jgi:hypothetical protein
VPEPIRRPVLDAAAYRHLFQGADPTPFDPFTRGEGSGLIHRRACGAPDP